MTMAEKTRAYRARHPERVREQRARYYKERREAALAYARGYRQRNRLKTLQAQRRWWAREKYTFLRRKGRTMKELGRCDARDVARLFARHGGLCGYCRRSEAVGIDHVVPVSRGGRHTIGNVTPCCARCNSSKGNKLLIEWRALTFSLGADCV